MKPYYESGGIVIYHGDCRDVLPTLGRFDLVLTDPPYGRDIASRDLGAGRTTGIASSRMLYGQWDRQRIGADLMHLVLSCATDAIIWGGNYYADMLKPSQCWLIWDKRGGLPQRSYADVELAWTSFDRASRLYTHRWDGFIRDDAEQRNGHPTQKPLGLFQWALSLTEAATVVDPFLGGGTTLSAARNTGRRAVGIEEVEAYCEIAARRLDQQVLELGA